MGAADHNHFYHRFFLRIGFQPATDRPPYLAPVGRAC